jgi:RHS repeat-associated protein
MGLEKESDVGGESSWAATHPVSDVYDGKYNVPFEGVDADGVRNTGYHGLEVDQTPPGWPDLEQPRGTLYTRLDTTTVGGTAEPGDEIIVHVGGSTTLTTTADKTEEARWRLDAPLVEGSNEIWAEARDRAGNLSPHSASGWVVRDTQPPAIPASGVSPLYARHGTIMVVTATVVEANLVQVVADFEVMSALKMTLDGDIWRAQSPLPSSGLSDGPSTVTVVAEDRVDFSTSRVLTFTIDNTPPQANLTGVSEDSPYAHVSGSTVYYGDGSGSFTVDVEANDATAGLDALTFPATTSDGASYDYDGETSVSKSHSYTFDANDTFSASAAVTATDRAGNPTTVPFTITRDAISPTVTITVPACSAVVTVAVAWSGDDGAGSGVARYDVQVRQDDGPWSGWLTDTAQTEADFVGAIGHRYTFRVTATDNVGNVGQGEAETRVAAITKYYYFPSSGSGRGGGQRVAMRGPDDAVVWLHGDHLGSTSLATNAAQEVVTRQWYYPFGGQRAAVGVSPTDFGFTGQRLAGTIGLYDYHARFYDPLVGRFISADSIVPDPGNPQALNRYSYANNNPLVYVDPSGHTSILEAIRRLISGMLGVGDVTSPGVVTLDEAPPVEIPPSPNFHRGGSREALYAHAYNFDLAPWQDNPDGSIDERFDPFYEVDPTVYREVGEALYEPYGGLANLGNLAVEQCYWDHCNNPLNYEDNLWARLGEVPQSVAGVTVVGVFDNAAMTLFLQKLPEEPDYDVGWNYEPLWLATLMELHPKRLLEAQWRYLAILEELGEWYSDPAQWGELQDYVE